MEKTQNEIIKEICTEFNCTQKELAVKIGVSKRAVNQWSDGTRKIPSYFYKSVEFVREIHKLNAELKEKYNNKSLNE